MRFFYSCEGFAKFILCAAAGGGLQRGAGSPPCMTTKGSTTRTSPPAPLMQKAAPCLGEMATVSIVAVDLQVFGHGVRGRHDVGPALVPDHGERHPALAKVGQYLHARHVCKSRARARLLCCSAARARAWTDSPFSSTEAFIIACGGGRSAPFSLPSLKSRIFASPAFLQSPAFFSVPAVCRLPHFYKKTCKGALCTAWRFPTTRFRTRYWEGRGSAGEVLRELMRRAAWHAGFLRGGVRGAASEGGHRDGLRDGARVAEPQRHARVLAEEGPAAVWAAVRVEARHGVSPRAAADRVAPLDVRDSGRHGRANVLGPGDRRPGGAAARVRGSAVRAKAGTSSSCRSSIVSTLPWVSYYYYYLLLL